MARVVDLTGENVTRQRRKERNFGTKTDLPSTSVERGNTHWTDGSNVNIDGFLGVAGTMTVSGVLSVTGTFNASGSINLSGSTSVTGPMEISGTTTITGSTNILGELNVTGPTTLDGILDIGGDTTISGTLDIEGNTTVASDFEIISGGLFKSGVTKIEPNGKATFGSFIIDPASPRLIQAPGGWLFSNGADSIGLAGSSTSSVNLNSEVAELDYGGLTSVVARAGAIDLNAPKTWVNGEAEVSGTFRAGGLAFFPGTVQATWNAPPNVYMDAQGRLYRTPWVPAS